MGARQSEVQRAAFITELGWMALAWRGPRLVRLTMGHPSAAAALASLEADEMSLAGAKPGSGELPRWVADLIEKLQAYAAGDDADFADVPVDLSHLTDFQRKVVAGCRRIGRGRVKSYGELAQAAGSPGAARAVGNVMARNRFPIIVPCHRVVGSGKSLGGFSAPEGICLKQKMLDLEAGRAGQRRFGS